MVLTAIVCALMVIALFNWEAMVLLHMIVVINIKCVVRLVKNLTG